MILSGTFFAFYKNFMWNIREPFLCYIFYVIYREKIAIHFLV